MIINTVQSREDANPVARELSWREFATWLSTTRYTSCGLSCVGSECTQKNGSAYLPVSLVPVKGEVRRKKANVFEIHALSYDIDKVSAEEILGIRQRLDATEHIWYSTHQDQREEGVRRFRLVLQLSQPVPVKHWSALRQGVIDLYQIKADPQTPDPSRLFYFPTTPKGRDYEFYLHTGQPIDVLRLLGLSSFETGGPSATTPTPKESSSRAHVDPTGAYSEGISYTDFVAKVKSLQRKKAKEPFAIPQEHAELLRRAIEQEPLAEEGNRDTALVRTIGVILVNLGPQWHPCLRPFLEISCRKMGEEILTSLDYKIKRGAEHATEQYETRRAALYEACEAVARQGVYQEDTSEDPVVNSFNKKFFVGWNSGLTDCIYWHDTEDGVKPISEQAIKIATSHLKELNEKGRSTYQFNKWKDHKETRRYKKVHFAPMQELPEGEYNLFRGYAYEPKEGDCSLFKEFMWEVICGSNEELYRYVFTWFAQLFQRPYDRPGTSLILFSEDHGVGKGFCVNTFGKLLGKDLFISECNAESVFGKFTGHLECTLLINVDEAKGSRDLGIMDAVKNAITEPTRMVEHKGLKRYRAPNYSWYIYTTNNPDVVHIDPSDRRFVVIEPSSAWLGQYDKFNELKRSLENGGYEALLYELLELNIEETGVNLKVIPQTAARDAMKVEAMPYTSLFIQEFLQDPTLTEVKMKALYDELAATKPRYLPSIHKFARELKRLTGDALGPTVRTMVSGERFYANTLDLAKARANFDAKYKIKTDWTPIVTTKTVEEESAF